MTILDTVTNLKFEHGLYPVTHGQQLYPANKAAFTQLIKQHRGDVLRRCMSYLKNRDDAEDATQETILRAFRGMDSFRGDSNFRTWLFAIADNQCHTLAAKRSRLVLIEENSGLLELEGLSACDREQNVSGHTYWLHEALHKLPEMSRDIVILRFFSEMSLVEISLITGLSLSATKMRLYRALQELKNDFNVQDLELLAA